MPRVFCSALILVGVGVVVTLLWTQGASVSPPVFKLEDVEPAGISDERGEMRLVTISIQNPDDSPRRDNWLYVQDLANPIQVRLTNVWGSIEGSLKSGLRPGQKHQTVVLVTGGAEACRFSFRYCGASLSFKHQPFKARLGWLAEQLPLSVRSRFSYKFWRWVGFGPDAVPSGRWKRGSWEVPVPAGIDVRP